MNIWTLATGALFGFLLGLLPSPNRSLARVPRPRNAASKPFAFTPPNYDQEYFDAMAKLDRLN